MGYKLNIFGPEIKVVDIEIVNSILTINYSDNSHSTYNNAMWVIERDPDIEGVTSTSGNVHMVQDGAVNGLGLLGYIVSSSTPLIINSVSMDNIEQVKQYLKINLQ